MNYEIDVAKRWLRCLICGFYTFNRHDIENHYCGLCHVFLDDVEVGA